MPYYLAIEKGEDIYMSKNDILHQNKNQLTDEEFKMLELHDQLMDEQNIYHYVPFDKFVVNLYQGSLYIDGDNLNLLLGTLSTIAINYFRDGYAKRLQPISMKLYTDYQTIINNPFVELKKSDIKNIEKQLLKITELIEPLIIFNNRIPEQNHFSDYYDICMKSLKSDEIFRQYFSTFVRSYFQIVDAILSFYRTVYPLSERWMTESIGDFDYNYAESFDDFLQKLEAQPEFITPFTPLAKPMFQTMEINSYYHTTSLPDSNKKVFVEQIAFYSYQDLLQFDFFKALQIGHAVKICRNCRRAFLETTKYHTVYCDRIAPNEANKTCRQVGAQHYEKEKIKNSPIHQLYKKCYKKLNQRYNRGTITLGEFNESISHIQQLRDDALKGNLSVKKLKILLNSI